MICLGLDINHLTNQPQAVGMSYRILITDPVDSVCTDLIESAGMVADVQLGRSDEALIELARNADGWIIRSGTKIAARHLVHADKLKLIARAGVGVDNVDVPAATRRGIIVVNAPDGNTISTAEHTCGMLIALSRHIPQGHVSLQAGMWDRKRFTGQELQGKTLGIIGLGKIGMAVAERMRAFGMNVIAFDPVVQPKVAEERGIESVSLETLYAESDFITVHTPLNSATKGLLNADTFAKCKPGVRVVNCARGGIVEEGDILPALNSGQLGGIALDVYAVEPPPQSLSEVIAHPNVVVTPHLAASTTEAQVKVAEHVTREMIRFFETGIVQTPVNAFALAMAARPEAQPYLSLVGTLASCAAQLTDDPMREITISTVGEKVRRYQDVIKIGALRGVLSRTQDRAVNLINAEAIAEDNGLVVRVETRASEGPYGELIQVIIGMTGGAVSVTGTLIGGAPRLVEINGYRMEVVPEGTMLLYENEDRPGMLATVGRLLADAAINIGALSLGRTARGGKALALVTTDDVIPEHVLDNIASIDGVTRARIIQQ